MRVRHGCLLLVALAWPASARAAATCSYDPVKRSALVQIGAGTSTVESTADSFTVDGQPCGKATLANTDLITATPSSIDGAKLVLSLAGGTFGDAKVDVQYSSYWGGFHAVTVRGSAGADDIVDGQQSVDLNADGKIDVERDHFPTWTYELGEGDDAITTAGQDGAGDDTNSHVFGGAGDDTLHGGGWSDTLHGEAGQDTIADAGGNQNQLDGGEGVDTITGSGGWDVLRGGPGSDHLEGGPGRGDVASFDDAEEGVVADAQLGLAAADGFGGIDVIVGIEGLIGGAGDDVLLGTDEGNAMHGGAGDDVIEGRGNDERANNDSISGGDGDDTLRGGDGEDWMHGNAGDDTLEGGEGDDEMSGDAGDDDFDGGAGRDLARLYDPRRVHADLRADVAEFVDGSGSEALVAVEDLWAHGTVIGDDGPNDLAAYGNDIEPDIVIGNGGDDRLSGDVYDYSGAPGPIKSLPWGIEDGQGGLDSRMESYSLIRGSAFDDEIRAERAEGGPGDDTITGDGRHDTLEGGPGDDTIHGLWGTDTLSGGPGVDVLDGGEDSDAVDYGDAGGPVTASLALGAAALDGDGASDSLAGFERLVGSPHGDALAGDDAANWIDGRGGDDTLLAGGGGDDRIVTGPGDDAVDGGLGRDRLEYSGEGAPGPLRVDLQAGAASEDGFGTTDAIAGVEDVDGIDFHPADVEIRGDANANRLRGGHVHGRAGDDDLEGSLVEGGPGDDTLASQWSGVYDYSGASSGLDVDFNALQYPITVEDGDGGTDTVLTYGGIRGSSHADRIKGHPSWNSIDGGAGDDTITTYGGNDQITGGPGEDFVDSGFGDDELLLRDGFDDTAACGIGWDKAVVDANPLDPVSGCETVDRREAEPTPTPEPEDTPTPTPTPEPEDTPTPTPTPTPEPEDTPTPTPTPEPEDTPTPTPTPTPEPEPEDTPTPTPTPTPETKDTPTPTPTPTGVEPVPTATSAPAPLPLPALQVSARASRRSWRSLMRSGLPLHVACSRACLAKISVSASPDTRRRAKLADATLRRVTVVASGDTPVHLRIPTPMRNRLARLRSGRLRVTVVAGGSDGSVDRATFTVGPARPATPNTSRGR